MFKRLQRVRIADGISGYEWLENRVATVIQDEDILTGLVIVWFDGDASDERFHSFLLERVYPVVPAEARPDSYGALAVPERKTT